MDLSIILAIFIGVAILSAILSVILKALSILATLRRYALRGAIVAGIGAGGIGGISSDQQAGNGSGIMSRIGQIFTSQGGR